MRAVIDGLIYDTDTAELIFDMTATKYYRSPKGQFFQVDIIKDGVEFLSLTPERVIRRLVMYDIEMYTKLFGKPKEG